MGNFSLLVLLLLTINTLSCKTGDISSSSGFFSSEAYAGGVLLRTNVSPAPSPVALLDMIQPKNSCTAYQAVYVGASLTPIYPPSTVSVTVTGLASGNNIYSDNACTSPFTSIPIATTEKFKIFYLKATVAQPAALKFVITGRPTTSQAVLTVTGLTTSTPTPTPTATPVSTACSITKNPNFNGSKYIARGLWAWDPTFINTSSGRTTFINFALKRNITVVYLGVEDMLRGYNLPTTDPNRQLTTETNLPTFLNLAASNCISVHFLFGMGSSNSSLIETAQANAGYPEFARIFTNAKNYINSLPSTVTRPTALHLDIEPKQSIEWSTATKPILVQRHINVLQLARSILAASGTNPRIKLASDMGVWMYYNGQSTYSCDPNNNTVTPTLKNLTPGDCANRSLDQAVLMAYSDQAHAPETDGTPNVTGSADRSVKPMSYASAGPNFNGNYTQVVVGQETIDPAYGIDPSETFFEELKDPTKGISAMEKQLQIIQDAFNLSAVYGGYNQKNTYNIITPNQSSYKFPSVSDSVGIAVHHYDSHAYTSPNIVDNF